MRVYIAGTLKTDAGRNFLESLDREIRTIPGISIFLPHRDAAGVSSEAAAGLITSQKARDTQFRRMVFQRDLLELQGIHIAVFVLDGLGTGTFFELGYLWCLCSTTGQDMHILGLLTDVRGTAILDNMTLHACEKIFTSTEELLARIRDLANQTAPPDAA